MVAINVVRPTATMPMVMASPSCAPAMLMSAARVPWRRPLAIDECHDRTGQQRQRDAGDDESEIEMKGHGGTR